MRLATTFVVLITCLVMIAGCSSPQRPDDTKSPGSGDDDVIGLGNTGSSDAAIVCYDATISLEQQQELAMGCHYSPDRQYFLLADVPGSLFEGASWVQELYLCATQNGVTTKIFDFRSFFGDEEDRTLNHLNFFWDVDSAHIWMSRHHNNELFRYSINASKWENIDLRLPLRAIRFVWADTLLVVGNDEYGLYDMTANSYSPLPIQGVKMLPPVADNYGPHILGSLNDAIEGDKPKYLFMNIREQLTMEIVLPSPQPHIANVEVQGKSLVESLCFYPGRHDVISYINRFSFQGTGGTHSYLVVHNLKTGLSATLYLGEGNIQLDMWNADGTAFISQYRYLVSIDMEKLAHVIGRP